MPESIVGFGKVLDVPGLGFIKLFTVCRGAVSLGWDLRRRRWKISLEVARVVEVQFFGNLVDGSVEGGLTGAFAEALLDFEHAGEGDAAVEEDAGGGAALLEGEILAGLVNKAAEDEADEEDLVGEGGGIDLIGGKELVAFETGGVEAVFEGVEVALGSAGVLLDF